MKKCGIVVPIHNEIMNMDEKESLTQLKQILGGYDIILVHPNGLNIDNYKSIIENIISLPFSDEYFKDRMSYCKMCCDINFYEKFLDYEYILIYQLDCWVFKNELDYWCDKGYDYIGAPFFIDWFVKRNKIVGNGGFSLRKVQSIIKYLEVNNDATLPHFNTDDGFYAANYNDILNIPDANEAALFSLETFPRQLYSNTQTLPFGCHAFKKYDYEFWEKYINLKGRDEKDNRVLLCCIGKNENRYIKEYVDWYKHIGVTHIRIYDNNDIDGEHFEEVIGDYINNGFVDIVDYRGREVCQLQAYEECYKELGNEYDWVLFIDCGDEYLDFLEYNNISDYLSEPCFDGYDMIHINLMTFGDNEHILYEDKPLMERFPNPIPFETKVAYDFPENAHISSIVRGGLKNVLFRWTPHTPYPNEFKCCDDVGNKVDSLSPFSNISFRKAFFRHYSTKTAEEYCDKMKRGFPDQKWDGSRVKNLIETRFFRTNKITKEKVDIFKEKLGVDMSYLLPNKFEGEKRKDVQIYSLCYDKKGFKFIDNEVITPLQVGAVNGKEVCELKDNIGDNISNYNYFYIENTGTYWIWKNVKDAKYKGQMQYRRPLDGVNENMNFDDIFSKYDVITCEPFNHPANSKPTSENPMFIPAQTVEEGYAFSNCIDDLYILEMVIDLFYPEYKESYIKYIKKGEDLYYSNGFIMKSEDYDRYCEFLFDCLSKYQEFVDVSTPEKLRNRVVYNMGVGKYPKHMNSQNISEEAIRWQMSIGGFLSERIWTLWLLHNFNEEKIMKLPYIKMEEGMYT